jgi:hypothetical protein
VQSVLSQIPPLTWLILSLIFGIALLRVLYSLCLYSQNKKTPTQQDVNGGDTQTEEDEKGGASVEWLQQRLEALKHSQEGGDRGISTFGNMLFEKLGLEVDVEKLMACLKILIQAYQIM